ncbi:MAG: AgmX/PglI C-terminal domain-containing protein [Deltaproteobacteria bacterium]
MRRAFDSARVEAFGTGRFAVARSIVLGDSYVPTSNEPGGRDTTQADGGGTLDAAELARTVRSRVSRIRACYDVRLTGDPTLAGRIGVVFEINRTGRVPWATATVSNVRGDPTGMNVTADCIEAVFRAMDFTRPEGGSVQASFTFNFTPGP